MDFTFAGTNFQKKTFENTDLKATKVNMPVFMQVNCINMVIK